MVKEFTLFILICGMAVYVHAQEPAAQRVIEELLESSGEELTDDTNFQEILDDLEYLIQNPLEINQVGREELLHLHVLSELQINNLIGFRQKTGAIYSLYELASVDGFTPDILQKIEPFISFDKQVISSGKKKSSGNLFLRSTRSFSSADATVTHFEGSMERYYLRIKQSGSNFEYGLVAEKDPGEALFSQSNTYGFDYSGAFVNFSTGKAGNRIFAGDYHVKFGQGLVAWQGFSMGKSTETTQVFRSNEGIRSYSSTDENQFFRGLAAQFKTGNFIIYPFLAWNRLDAHIDSLEEKSFFGAFQTSGYHRTASEIKGENSLKQLAGGGHVAFMYERWSFGFSAVYNRFDVAMIRSEVPYNQFFPEGKENLVAGLNWKGSLKNIFLFGEAAGSKNGGKALLAGVLLKPAPNAELSAVYRNINKTYFSYFSNAFTESSRVNDEHGLYLGMKVFPAPKWIIQAYADFFSFNWIKYLTAAPANGTEFLGQISYQYNRETSFYLKFFQEEKEQRLISENLKYNTQQLINRLRFNFSKAMNEQISLKSRLEFSFYSKQGSEKGFFMAQDVIYKPSMKPYELNGRMAYFKTDGYNSRIYAYENDLLYSFSIPANYGNGIRGYLNFQVHLGDRFTLWLKFASTRKFALNNGEELIAATKKSDLKIQIRYQF